MWLGFVKKFKRENNGLLRSDIVLEVFFFCCDGFLYFCNYFCEDSNKKRVLYRFFLLLFISL